MTTAELRHALEEHYDRKCFKGKGDPRNPKDPSWEERHLETVWQRDARLRREQASAAKKFADLEARGQRRLFSASAV